MATIGQRSWTAVVGRRIFLLIWQAGRGPPMASTFIEHQWSSPYQRVRLQAGTPGSHIVQHDPSMAFDSDPNRDGVKPISSSKVMASPSRLNPAMHASSRFKSWPRSISSACHHHGRIHHDPPMVGPIHFRQPPDQLHQWQITEPVQDPGASIGLRLADLHGSSTAEHGPPRTFPPGSNERPNPIWADPYLHINWIMSSKQRIAMESCFNETRCRSSNLDSQTESITPAAMESQSLK
ncbi:hypothetical protein ACLOJK_029246 [Asimina triloba]